MAITSIQARDLIMAAYRNDRDKTVEIMHREGGLTALFNAVMAENVTLPSAARKADEWVVDVSNGSIERALVHVDTLINAVREGTVVDSTARGFLFMMLSDMRVDK